MSREAIDQMWQRALRQSIEDNEMLTRYHFDALVRADEREQHKAALLAERNLIAALVEQMGIEGYGTLAIAAAIRTRRIDK
jgi:hypothetical protein